MPSVNFIPYTTKVDGNSSKDFQQQVKATTSVFWGERIFGDSMHKRLEAKEKAEIQLFNRFRIFMQQHHLGFVSQ